jgi:hypothetical protein
VRAESWEAKVEEIREHVARLVNGRRAA